ncbi:UNVERIFIED_CONTAM: hypothetical protein GTU68_052660 [Idotea baltica]|nr:hypothetical protein [Idotea baltica]
MSTPSGDPDSSEQRLPLQVLKQYWGYDSFRPLQDEAINCAINGIDSVVVLPTGGGKSLCYQIPAICRQKVAVVVSPLISLMKDQVDSLVASGIPAAAVNSSMTDDEKRAVATRVTNGDLKLLYMAPERLVQPATIRFLQNADVGFFAIDEAHCISSWGHDFRPEYRQLSELKTNFPNASVHAFTATATERVRQDIARQLNLASAQMLVGSFDRENLLYRVHRRDNTLAQMREIVDRYPNQSGIVYCISRKEVENVAATLSAAGLKARPYHAGLSQADRSTHQDEFINEQIDIIVATVAFGMGIDKSNVRYVIHTGMPKSLEAYQQESGRAGRDGLQSECALLYSGGDLMSWKRMMNEPQEGATELLEAMYSYCTRSTCRHQMLVEYFGQSFDKETCGACDVCLGELNVVADPLIVSQKIISCVHRVSQRFGTTYVSQVLTGSTAKKIMQSGHNSLSTYGLLSQHKQTCVADWIEQLVGQGFLLKSGEYNVLKITDSGRKVLKGEVTPDLIEQNIAAKTSKQDDWSGVDRELFAVLQELRRECAQTANIPPFVIFHDVSLRDMARQRPSTVDDFEKIAGVSQKKLADFGAAFVESICEFCQKNNIAMDQPGIADLPAPPQPKMLNKTKLAAFELFATGESVEDVASRIDRAVSTTFGYLGEYIRSKQITEPSPWVDSTTSKMIQAAATKVGSLERLAPIKEILSDDVGYEQIRVVIECLKVETCFIGR